MTLINVFRSPELQVTYSDRILSVVVRRASSVVRRPSSVVRRALTFHILDISSESCWPILTKLGMHDPLEKAFHICTKYGAGPPRGPTRGQKWLKLGQTSKIFFSETKMATA